MKLTYDELSPAFKKVVDSIELALIDVRTLSREQWDKEFDFKSVIWVSELHRLYFKRKKFKFNYWSRVSIDGDYYLIPGITDTDLLYRTKKLIDYNVIVKL